MHADPDAYPRSTDFRVHSARSMTVYRGDKWGDGVTLTNRCVVSKISKLPNCDPIVFQYSQSSLAFGHCIQKYSRVIQQILARRISDLDS